jgi:hypothetical protein
VDRRLAFAIGLVLVAITLAGCLEDVERRKLDADWRPEVQVDESPVREVHGAPAMVVAQGPVELPSDVDVTATGLLGELSRPNASIELQAMRVDSGDGTQRAGDAEGELTLSDGENLTVTFVPADDAPRRASPAEAWNLSLEVQWRYRDSGEFDAGRLETERNLTPQPVPELGVGVVERTGDEIHRLVFEAIDVDELPDTVELEVLEVGGGTVDTVGRVDADVQLSEGTARLHPDENVSVPEGSGYLALRSPDVDGTATTALTESEDPIPGFTTTGALIAGLVLAIAARRRRE